MAADEQCNVARRIVEDADQSAVFEEPLGCVDEEEVGCLLGCEAADVGARRKRCERRSAHSEPTCGQDLAYLAHPQRCRVERIGLGHRRDDNELAGSFARQWLRDSKEIVARARIEGGNDDRPREAEALCAVIGGSVQGRIVTKDRAFELLQRGARLEPELVHEPRPRGPVDGKCVRLPSTPVEREHQQRGWTLPQRVLSDERLQLGHDLALTAAGEIRFEEAFECYEPQLVEPSSRRAQNVSDGDVPEGSPTPEVQRFTKQLCRRVWAIVPERARAVSGESFEPVQVEGVRLEPQDVAGLARLNSVATQRFAQRGDIPLQDVCRCVGRIVTPDGVDQTGH